MRLFFRSDFLACGLGAISAARQMCRQQWCPANNRRRHPLDTCVLSRQSAPHRPYPPPTRCRALYDQLRCALALSQPFSNILDPSVIEVRGSSSSNNQTVQWLDGFHSYIFVLWGCHFGDGSIQLSGGVRSCKLCIVVWPSKMWCVELRARVCECPALLSTVLIW